MSTSRSLNFAGELGTIQTFAGTGEFELYGAKEQYHQLDLGGHMRGTVGWTVRVTGLLFCLLEWDKNKEQSCEEQNIPC